MLICLTIFRPKWIEYSVDGEHFTSFGDAYQLGWGHYRGDRIGVYSYNCEREQGYIDVDQFCYVAAGAAKAYMTFEHTL